MLDINKISNFHNQAKKDNLSYEYRFSLLTKLKQTILKHQDELLLALKKDLNKSESEAFLSEVNVVLFEIDYHLKHLRSWMKTKKISDNIETFMMKSYIKYVPKGKALVISPFNYPFNLTLMPIIGAISAGNKIMVKMATDVKHTRTITYQILIEALGENNICCIEPNQINSYDDLYAYEPNIVFFTGSTNVGKKIELECVKRNIDYVTELGGQSPCIVYGIENEVIYDRIVWAKFLNAGQTCVCINYLLCNVKLSNFMDHLIKAIKKQYPDPLKNQNIAKIINKKAFDRLVNIIKEQRSNIVYGGRYDEETLIIEPTIINVQNEDDLSKYGEIFGPILLVYNKLDDDINNYIKIVNKIDPSPLAAYFFLPKALDWQKLVYEINAGGYCINDAISQIINNKLPFGGVYTSGSGSYHGWYSFETFSFRKPIVVNNLNKDNQLKYFNNNGLSYEEIKKKINTYKKVLFFK